VFDVGCGSLIGGMTCRVLLMWTDENAGRYDRRKLPYSSDLTDEELGVGRSANPAADWRRAEAGQGRLTETPSTRNPIRGSAQS